MFVQPFGGQAPRIQVSRGGGVHPRWRADGRELVYWAQPGGLVAVEVALETAGGQVGIPRPLISARVHELIDGRTHYDMARDGQRFLVRQPAAHRTPPIEVVLNWAETLKR